MKVLFRSIHLYLSLAAGLVIAILCFTGAVLVFEKELEEALHPERYRVSVPASAARRPLDELVSRVQARQPQAKVTGVKVYADPARTVEVSLAGEPPKEGAKGAGPAREGKSKEAAKGGKKPGGGEGGGGPRFFVNPYTGEVIGPYVYRDTFFFSMFALHRGMVAGAAGKLVVGVSTIFFLVIILTGMVLWVPATGKVLRQRLTVKWDASWKRLNHDLHIVLGFYAALFLFVFAFTGLAWSFEWFNKGIFTLTSSEMKGPEPPRLAPAAELAAGQPSLGAFLAAARQQAPAATYYAIQLPREPEAAVRVNVLPADAAHESAVNELYLDQHSARPLGQLRFTERNLGQRVRRTFKPVHTGAIYGTPSKILALIVCILGVSFPVTGVIMWLNRLKKERKKLRRVAQPA